MRHRYETRGIVLSRVPSGESSALVTIITPELGLIRALVQGIRAEGSKLAPALVTLAESSFILVRGKDGWRVAGAVCGENWCLEMVPAARVRAARISGLLLRLVVGEAEDKELFPIVRSVLEAFTHIHESTHEEIEMLGALSILSALGFDESEALLGHPLTQDLLAEVRDSREHYISRINRGITASGL
jgi:hypothetical protein